MINSHLAQKTIYFIAILLSFVLPVNAQFVDQPGASRIKLESKDFGYFYDTLRWPPEPSGMTVVRVCWESGVLPTFSKEVDLVRLAIADSWQKHGLLEFRGWTTCAQKNAGIRIVVVESGPRVNAFGTQLDDLPGGMELNFGFDNWGQVCKQTEQSRELCIKSIAVHEFGHALGFAHEQDRADAPGECARLHGTGATGKDLAPLTPYDPDSVMNYCNPVYNNDGKLSVRDMQSVQAKYGVPVR